MTVRDTLIEAINAYRPKNGKTGSRYALSKATEISQSTLCRFINGERGLSFKALQILLDELRLEIVPKKEDQDVKLSSVD